MATKKRKTRKKTKSLSSKIKILFWFLIISVTSLSLFLVLSLPPRIQQSTDIKDRISSDQKVQDLSAKKESPIPKKKAKKKESPPAQDKARVYEEFDPKELTQKIRQIDLALVQSLIIQGINPDKLKHENIANRKVKNHQYYHQSLIIKINELQRQEFLGNLKQQLSDWVPQAKLKTTKGTKNNYSISIHNVPTHLLILKKDGHIQPDNQVRKGPKMAIVIDDLGEDFSKAKELLDIFDKNITWSILPYCTHTQDIVSLANKNRVEILLHLPMEPLSYPETNPGPGSLFVDMDKEDIISVLRQDLLQIEGAVGVSNHMGSKFTSDRDSMSYVLTELKKKNLFFLDSLTNSHSQGRELSRQLNLPHMSRDIFLDNEQKVESIIFQLQKAQHLAQRSGQVVAIGHPYEQTLTALKQWSKQRNGQVELCKLSQLINN